MNIANKLRLALLSDTVKAEMLSLYQSFSEDESETIEAIAMLLCEERDLSDEAAWWLAYDYVEDKA